MLLIAVISPTLYSFGNIFVKKKNHSTRILSIFKVNITGSDNAGRKGQLVLNKGHAFVN